MGWRALKAREWKWANSEKTIENQRQRDLAWHDLRKQRQKRPSETQRQSISRRRKERASLAGASGWLQLFNALINPLLKAKQRVSGFVLWPCDYSGINKGWAGNTDEISLCLLYFALWLFSNKAGDGNDMQQRICQPQARLLWRVGMLNRHLGMHVLHMLWMNAYKRTKLNDNSQCMRLFSQVHLWMY